jgi:hypothetical protein
MRLSLRTPALAGAVAAVMSLAAQAAVVTVHDSVDDFEAQHNSTTGAYIASENFTSGSRVGFQSNFNGTGTGAPGGITSLYFFQLPALAPGESITSASFSLGTLPDSSSAATTVAPTFNADLYALGVVNSVSKTAADAQKYFYLGHDPQTALPVVDGAAPITGSVQRLVDDFLTPNAWIPNGGTPGPAMGGNLTSYILNLYANQAANGFTPGTSYLVLRLNPDADSIPTSGTQRFTTTFEGQGTATSPGAGTAETRPLVTLNVVAVPEPASAGLLLIGAAALLRRRRNT